MADGCIPKPLFHQSLTPILCPEALAGAHSTLARVSCFYEWKRFVYFWLKHHQGALCIWSEDENTANFALTSNTSKNLSRLPRERWVSHNGFRAKWAQYLCGRLFTGATAAADAMPAMWGCSGVVRGAQVCEWKGKTIPKNRAAPMMMISYSVMVIGTCFCFKLQCCPVLEMNLEQTFASHHISRP